MSVGSGLNFGSWWQSAQGWLPWPAAVQSAPALWSWWWAQAPAAPHGRYRSARGLAKGAYRYRSRGGDAMGAIALPPTPTQVQLRTRDRFVPLQIDFAREMAQSDSICAAQVTVYARPVEQQGAAPDDVTGSLLMGQQVQGTQVTVVLGGQGAQVGADYSVVVAAQMQSGLTLSEQIGDCATSRITCDA